jgi:hypothetical protein
MPRSVSGYVPHALAFHRRRDASQRSLRSVDGGFDDVRDVIVGRCRRSSSSINSSRLKHSRLGRPMPIEAVISLSRNGVGNYRHFIPLSLLISHVFKDVICSHIGQKSC